MRCIIGTLLCLVGVVAFGVQPGEETILPSGREWIAATTKVWGAEAGDGVKVWPGVRADKEGRRVEIAAMGAGTAEAGLLEFLLVAEKGKAYESVAVTTAKPSDVVRALRFIGMPAGRPIDYSARHFWPRGERVTVAVVPVAADGIRSEALKGEELVKHRERADKGSQFVFVGSSEADGEGGAPVINQTGDLISLYSNPFAVFDVHQRTPQGEHYGATTVQAKGAMAQEQRLIFVLQPEYGPDKQRIVEVAVGASPAAETGRLAFSYQRLPGGDRVPALELPEVLAKLQQLIEAGHDPFVRVQFAPETPLSLAAEFAKMLDLAAARGLLRVEPVAGEPYYQALLPDEQWRDRSKRPGQPVEIHGERGAGGWAGRIIRPKFVRAESGWDVKVSEAAFGSVGELREKVLGGEDEAQALFYYLPEATTYADLLSLYGLFGEKFPTQYVFLNAAE